MSVLINMEMPTSCYDCNFAYQDQDSEHNVYWICAVIHKSACMYERRDDYPLIPIPEHGRLVDADAMAERWEDYIIKGNIKPLLVTRPTIIKAEEDKT